MSNSHWFVNELREIRASVWLSARNRIASEVDACDGWGLEGAYVYYDRLVQIYDDMLRDGPPRCEPRECEHEWRDVEKRTKRPEFHCPKCGSYRSKPEAL